jgi:8-oxo-dGTP pyrophosphatase MutT (NUDIX family)
MMERAPERLRRALQAPLPGHERFLQISGYPRPNVEKALAQVPPPRESAVLALFYHRRQVLHTLLMLRPTYVGVHSGQVGFPGGKREADDPSLEHTALREFVEETGAEGTRIEVLGSLSRVYIPPSRTIVTPFVGYAPELGALRPDPHEVELLIETPVDELLRDDILKRRVQTMPTGQAVEIPYFDVQGHVVWGATALMIAELRELLLRQAQ